VSLERLDDITRRIEELLRSKRGQRATAETLLKYTKGAGVLAKGKRRKKSCVRVFLDDEPLVVPRHVDCHWAARGALGLRTYEPVAAEDHPEQALTFEGGYSFRSGERFVKMIAPEREEPSPAATPTPAEPPEDDRTPFERGIAEDDPNWWKRG
jgi:hypothetical protein